MSTTNKMIWFPVTDTNMVAESCKFQELKDIQPRERQKIYFVKGEGANGNQVHISWLNQ